eukprot:3808577-Amphidinium_carterae.1
MAHPPRKGGFRERPHASSQRVYILWVVACVLSSVWAQERSGTEWSHLMVPRTTPEIPMNAAFL